MSDYDTRAERAAVEAELDELPVETGDTSTVSTVVSVRLRADELAVIERAASDAGLRLGTFIRQAALTVATEHRLPIDQRQIEDAARQLARDIRRLVVLAGADPRRTGIDTRNVEKSAAG